jgi:hypothetical protein
MKRSYFKFMLVLIGFASLTLTSCKKTASPADSSISAQDVSNVSNAMHSTSDDAAAAAGQVSSYKSLAGNNINFDNPNGNFLVGATVTDTSSTGIVITYDGTTACNGFYRSGTITITKIDSLPWSSAGGLLSVNYDNVKVTDIVSSNTYTLNGTHTITNVNGGLAWKVMAGLAPGTTVTHRIKSSNMSITFPNGTTSTWNVDRTRTWNSSSTTPTLYTVTVSSSPGSGNITERGNNRFGEAFTNSITSPVAANSNCAYRPYTGTWEHQIGTVMVTVQFGTDPSGNPQNNPTYCGSYGSYGFYITYTNGTRVIPRFVSYWR